ncbi:hypothetical protein FRB99_000108 [Tulasnella sp. 403]|nr:hypothetical protein FRB99_000108 [Tulasnella sp. 403]
MPHLYRHLRVHQVFGANTDVGKTVITTALCKANARIADQRLRKSNIFYLKPVSTGPNEDADDIPTPSGTTQVEAYRPLRLPTILIGDAKLGGISSTISAYESLLLRGFDVEALLLFREDYYRNWEYLQEWFSKRNQSAVTPPVRVGVVPPPPPRLADPQADYEALSKYYEDACSSDVLHEVVKDLEGKHESRWQTLQSMSGRSLDQVWWPFVQHGMIKGEKDITVIDSANEDFFDVYKSNVQSDEPPNQNSLQPFYDSSASWWTQCLGHSNSSLNLAAAYAAGRYGHVIHPLAIHEPALRMTETLLKDGPGKGWASRVFISDNGSTAMEVALKMAIRAASLRYQPNPDGPKRELEVIGLKGSYHGDTIGAMDACEGGTYNAAVEWYRGRGHWFDPPLVTFRRGQLCVVAGGEWASYTHQPGSEMCVNFPSLAALYDVEKRLHSCVLTERYRHHVLTTLKTLVTQGRTFGALVIEPLVMGAGGMLFVDPLFHRVLIDTVRANEHLFARPHKQPFHLPSHPTHSWSGLPVIFDEVFSGLYRLGVQTSSTILKTHPDISVHAKILTGGLLPLSITLASSHIFDAFYTDKKVDALLHGHSYTAHPMGCVVANETLNLIERMKTSGAWDAARSRWGVPPAHATHEQGSPAAPEAWSFWDPAFVKELSQNPLVQDTMTLGTVLAFRLADQSGGYKSTFAQEVLSSLNDVDDQQFKVHYRTLGDVGYFIASLNTPDEVFRALEARIASVLSKQK